VGNRNFGKEKNQKAEYLTPNRSKLRGHQPSNNAGRKNQHPRGGNHLPRNVGTGGGELWEKAERLHPWSGDLRSNRRRNSLKGRNQQNWTWNVRRLLNRRHGKKGGLSSTGGIIGEDMGELHPCLEGKGIDHWGEGTKGRERVSRRGLRKNQHVTKEKLTTMEEKT